MKKKILFVYYDMMLGGSTTSLLSLLHNIDYKKYEVDLLLYKNEGPFYEYIPKKVNVLEQACVQQPILIKIVKLLLSGYFFKVIFAKLKYKKNIHPMYQYLAYSQLNYCRKIEKEYDVAVGFLELWPDIYVNSELVKAKKKITWIHMDYEKSGYDPRIDRKMLEKSNYVVCVSEECLQNFNKVFPELKNKSVFVPNILTKGYLLSRCTETVDNPCKANVINLLSVCRIDIETKGLDRGLKAIKCLIKDGYQIHWYIIGGGFEYERFSNMIAKEGMNQYITLLGQKNNPYPYFQYFDALFFPSRREGKPMAVTEAQMLGLPILATNYAAACEQIENGIDGIVEENSEEGVYRLLEKICKNPERLKELKKNTVEKNYDNLQDIEYIYTLFFSK